MTKQNHEGASGEYTAPVCTIHRLDAEASFCITASNEGYNKPGTLSLDFGTDCYDDDYEE